MVEWWKNFEFLSPSIRPWTLNFCFQRVSSYLSLISIWFWIFVSSEANSLIFPFIISCSWSCSIFSSNYFFSLKTFPKVSLFHSLCLDLINLSQWWKWYIGMPWMFFVSYHQQLILSKKVGWEIQKDSNLKGRGLGASERLRSNLIDQWSEPVEGRI